MNAPPSQQEALYKLLVSLLIKCPQTVEIVPGDGSNWTQSLNSSEAVGHVESEPTHSPFMFVEDNLGIPQKVLFKVYLHAVGVFKAARRSCTPTGRCPTTPKVQLDCNPDTSSSHCLAASSSVLILANPSHQTALNARKHLVRMRLIDPHAELRFMASLLTSQHCAKHAELWYHRRWLLAAAYDPVDMANTDRPLRLQFPSQKALQQEFDLVSRACELHPRNYFAWTHRLMCMRSLLSDLLAGTDTLDFVPIFRCEIARVKEWINRHVSDYSAIHFILTLSKDARRSRTPSLVEIVIKENLLDHAISLVQAYPTHEALWMYIRITLSISDPCQTQQIQQFVDSFVYPLVHLQDADIGIKDDLVLASQYAKQFLEKKKLQISL